MSNKPFLTYQQQITLLQKKNVLISDKAFAKEVLSSISYYNIINGYKDIFETYYDDEDKLERFKNKVTLENLHYVYLLDNSFNNLLFKYIIYIENTLKTKLSYNVAMHIGQKQSEYCDFRKYTNNNPLDRKEVINKVTNEFSYNKNNKSIQHYKENHDHTPPWIAVKALYFGTVINWYKVLPPPLKENVAGEFLKTTTLESEEKKEFLVILFNLLHEYRNNIAHGSRTFLSNVSSELNKTLLLKIVDSETLTSEDYDQDIGKRDLFAVIISIAILINDPIVFRKYLKDLITIISEENEPENLNRDISPKGNIFKTLNIPENIFNRIANIYNNKFISD